MTSDTPFPSSGLRPARFEEHFRVLLCRSIKQRCRNALQVSVEESYRVRIDNIMRPLAADRPAEANSWEKRL
jgi:hypothetical protein